MLRRLRSMHGGFSDGDLSGGWTNPAGGATVDPVLAPTLQVPPTFLVQAENDYTAHVENVLIYFEALKNAKVPAELHVYTLGGHGFGMGAKELPISGWTGLAGTWLKDDSHPGSAGDQWGCLEAKAAFQMR